MAAELQIRTSRGDRLLTQRITKIPAERWTLFRRRLEEARVWQWHNRYDNFSITDGTNWHLELAWAGHKMNSAGQNAYPDSDGFRAVIAAIVELQHGIPVFPRAIK